MTTLVRGGPVPRFPFVNPKPLSPHLPAALALWPLRSSRNQSAQMEMLTKVKDILHTYPVSNNMMADDHSPPRDLHLLTLGILYSGPSLLIEFIIYKIHRQV